MTLTHLRTDRYYVRMPVTKGSTIDPERTRATILEATAEVFYERGIDGIGIAELCARLKISKETLYRHFGSKDGLVDAMLEARSVRVIRWLESSAAAAGPAPADQLSAIFVALQQWFEEPAFRGCAMLNAAAQHNVEPVRVLVTHHLDRYLGLLTTVARRAGVVDPELLGRQLLTVAEGATVVAANHHVRGAGSEAERIALLLLSDAPRRTADHRG